MFPKNLIDFWIGNGSLFSYRWRRKGTVVQISKRQYLVFFHAEIARPQGMGLDIAACQRNNYVLEPSVTVFLKLRRHYDLLIAMVARFLDFSPQY